MAPATTQPHMAVAMRYRDVAAAVEWLCAAFGFEKGRVVTGADGSIGYAQLTLGSGMILLEPVGEAGLDGFMVQPDEIGGGETQSCYFTVADADAHYARARAAGAGIVSDIADFESGGRGYSARDPEGHVWTFGTFDPWGRREPAVKVVTPSTSQGAGRLRAALVLLACIAASAAAGAWFNAGHRPSEDGAMLATAERRLDVNLDRQGRVADDTAQREAVEHALRALRDEVALERTAREAAQREAQELQRVAAMHQSAKEAAERAIRQMGEELAQERRIREAAERQAQDLLQQAKLQADASQSAREALKMLEEERRAREAAERQMQDLRQRVAALPSGDAMAALERTAREMREEAERQRNARSATEREVGDLRSQVKGEATLRQQAERERSDLRAELARLQAARNTVEQATESVRQQMDEQRVAREAAEHTVQELRTQLEAEQNNKRLAWRIVSDLRKQIGQLQRRAKAGGDDAVSDDSPPAAQAKQPRKRSPASKASP